MMCDITSDSKLINGKQFKRKKKNFHVKTRRLFLFIKKKQKLLSPIPIGLHAAKQSSLMAFAMYMLLLQHTTSYYNNTEMVCIRKMAINECEKRFTKRKRDQTIEIQN